MKTLTIILIAFGLHPTMHVKNSYAQTKVTGHIFAEIIESVSASSPDVVSFDLKSMPDSGSLSQPEQREWNYENIKLGEIQINSNKALTCNIVVLSAFLSDNRGNDFTIEPFPARYGKTIPQHPEKCHTLKISGTARIINGQESGLYQGTYSLTLAYN